MDHDDPTKTIVININLWTFTAILAVIVFAAWMWR